ncbi:putative Ig domain-containing protein, partial [Pelagicoccus sp. SDUM812003]|uniref:putative Ig domain-containing protein n=1 Tax=Pelagicoccus sp. SDUM812003 TaxID=3041267 RepID=UPI00280DF586
GLLSGTPENADVGEIAVTVTATDAAGATASDSFGISVTNTNDGPVATAIADQSATEDSAFSLDVSGKFSDVDAGDSLTYSATLENGDPLPSWLSIDATTGLLSGTPENADVGDIAVTVTASDLAGATASDTFGIIVVNTNNGPVAAAIADQTATEDSAFSLDISGKFSDVDADDSLSYSATLENGDPLPGWLSIDSTTGQLSGTPENADVGKISILVTATDFAGSSASSLFELEIANDNDGLVVSEAIADQQTSEASLFTLDVSGNFFDADVGDSTTYSSTLANGDPLPDWLSIDPDTGVLSGTPENEDVGELSVKVIASDQSGASASDVFTIEVQNTNDGPVATAIADQTATEDSAFSLDVSGSFSDVDEGDSLSYSATLQNGDPLPSWLSIDPTTGQLSGTPENADVGEIAVTVTAIDTAGASASETFGISVENTNDGPIVTSKSGLTASYHHLDTSPGKLSDIDFDAEADYVETVSEVDFNAGSGAAHEGGPTDDFAIQYEGFVHIDETGEWNFKVTGDDGYRLFVDGEMVLECDGQHVSTSTIGTVELPAGSHSIELIYFERGGLSNLTLEWQGPNDSEFSVIDESHLSPEAAVVANEDAAFTLDVGENFSDMDAGDVLTFSATLENGDPLPSWLSIDSTTGQLSGTPENEDVGSLHIAVTATDLAGASASSTYHVEVVNTNDGPVATAIADQTATEDSAFSLDVSGSFSDIDAGDSLTYRATLENG